jgi:hypothetical protein
LITQVGGLSLVEASLFGDNFPSLGAGGFNISLCDGSARFVSFEVDPMVHLSSLFLSTPWGVAPVRCGL